MKRVFLVTFETIVKSNPAEHEDVKIKQKLSDKRERKKTGASRDSPMLDARCWTLDFAEFFMFCKRQGFAIFALSFEKGRI